MSDYSRQSADRVRWREFVRGALCASTTSVNHSVKSEASAKSYNHTILISYLIPLFVSLAVDSLQLFSSVLYQPLPTSNFRVMYSHTGFGSGLRVRTVSPPQYGVPLLFIPWVS